MTYALYVLLMSLLVGCGSAPSEKAPDPLPNIIFILADDMGYGDVKLLHPKSKIPTPNLDRLGRQGMVFTNAHAPSAVCTPTRYAFLTGSYSWRSRMKQGVAWIWEEPLLKANQFTVATMLKQKGYSTGLVGKWHLGWHWPTSDSLPASESNGENVDYTQPIGGGPTTLGFDYYFGSDVPSFPPHAFIENDRVTQLPTGMWAPGRAGAPGAMVPGWTYEDLLPTLSEKSIAYVKEQAQTDNPFFLYYALSAPHTPIAPGERFQGKSAVGPYGDFVMEIDQYIGDLMRTLDSLGLSENTLVVFTSDNGPTNMDGTDYAGAAGSLLALGHNSSGDWKGLKSDAWEGGHREPFLVRWPAVIKSGTQSNALVSLVDMMATFADLAGSVLPESMAGDSYSLMPLWRQTSQKVRDHLIVQSGNGILALLEGDWKLITSSGGGGMWSGNGDAPHYDQETQTWHLVQLFDLTNDPSETYNLAAAYPSKVDMMMRQLASYISDGRTTQGPPLRNEGEQIWESISWVELLR